MATPSEITSHWSTAALLAVTSSTDNFAVGVAIGVAVTLAISRKR